MDTPSESPAAAPPSLTTLRIAAAIGLVAALVVVVVAFTIAWWFGLLALAIVPVLPMGFVLAVEAVVG